ncbi:nuclear transport factor 2 family protein [Azospirillum isscasi]|uniref:Nuclear transport factor 2 family protein n=1 Tax=Azospirillum isscasi TaxID=3053926 RepID=A0ABU0WBZ8_9PROT|nr:nuclear transport factor 2 family protein [Azospirillum isscasi]MDQ2101467.1 nuclear transport factor 2 family protein [Azospirillum isscasi]
MTDRNAVLATNRAFYRAFTERDFPAMDRLWASRLPVSCIHPGWTILFGREAVVSSWRDVLRAPRGPAVEARNERVSLYGDTAVVLCEEVLGNAVLAATNLFVREDGEWRLAHHQAGPVAEPASQILSSPDRPPPGGLLH